MKIVDCFWELKNLGCRVVEINIEKDDISSKNVILESINDYDYAVIKVPMNKIDFNIGLSELGFMTVETQMNISKSYKSFDFDDRLVRQVYPHLFERVIETKEELMNIVSRITSDMFTTDRIYLDPYFPKDSSRNRYVNWMLSEFEKGTSIITEFSYDGQNVGFTMYRETESGIRYGILGGVYEEFQSMGLGVATASIGLITAHKKNKPFKKIYTAISSNNIPMMQIYNYLNYKIESMTYVYVKHLK